MKIQKNNPMKTFNKKMKIIMLGLFCAVFSNASYAQCSNSNIQYGTSNAPTTVGSLTTLSSCMYGGEYRLVNNMQAGSQYSFETCGDTDFDTQLTIYDNVTGAVVAYNDDFCGLQSKASFTSNGNSVRVLVNKYFCTTQSSCMTLRVTRETGAPAVDPCNSITALSCTNNTGSFSLSGSGAWNGLGGPWSTPGAEQVYSFTPTLSGSHNISITNSSYYVDLYVNAGSCGPTGWTYIDDISSFGTGTNSVTLAAGVTYYFLIDDENTSASSGTISVTCPSPAVNPCNSITNIAACGTSASYSLASGNGAWNPAGPWGTPGNEAVFSYTPPTSGAYDIQVLNSGYYVDLFYKTGSCSSSGWSYVSDIFSNETNTVNLVGGVTYLFLIDDENTSASSGSINISCPCIAPPGGIDASYTYSSPFVISGTTVGACDDCSLRSSNDRVYAVTVPCAGNYSFTTCGGASWDTYLYLRTAPCGGSSIAINDDACGLQSRVSAILQPGTYYIHVEGFSSSSQGAFNLSVSATSTCNISADLSADVKACGYNISCNGLNDGAITATTNACNATYAWSNGSTDPSINGLSAGTYSVVVTDFFGCTASSNVTLTEPDPLVVDAGADQVVYYGYTPTECADLSGSASGGCANYSYAWSSGDNTAASTVCPQVTTNYTLVVTDLNGCSTSDEVTICAVDVICYAGNSNNQKVEMCQIPSGNPANAHTICISPNAVPAHLANGCTLGACGELDAICNGSAIAIDETNGSNKMGSNIYSDQLAIGEFSQYPNPASTNITLEFSTPTDENVNLTIVNIQGKRVASLYNSSTEANQAYKFNYDITNLQNGIYLIHFETSKGLVQKKFVVLK